MYKQYYIVYNIIIFNDVQTMNVEFKLDLERKYLYIILVTQKQLTILTQKKMIYILTYDNFKLLLTSLLSIIRISFKHAPRS